MYLGGALVTTGLGKVCRCPPDNVEGKNLKKAGIDAGRGGGSYALCATVLVPLLETFLPESSHAAEYSEELRTYSVLLMIKALHSLPLLIRNSRVDNIALHSPPLPSHGR